MTYGNPDPDPKRTTGLEEGGQVPPGETPPAEGGLSETGPRETHNPTKGWSTVPVVLIGIVVAAVLVFFVGYLIGLL
ncbi:DUF6480 family protein [Streptomyces smyrnaeus]|uniref:DUF6480 family protein n=1 Tax=Streptomyces TaxID=1883 RepID=UPI000C173D8A|nr:MULTISPECIES: DUF6480 family protein [unclassified Streptomyces]MBQ0866308.1 hypothetical protein [Streptomyces sp. RK75]MBQ1124391.1 hypothetical protein [Streptomyces sp. B15]MBQ1159928.1 hypothetical protein [Streptomyces sp. A73]